jgi:hypothetical protein
MSDPSNFEAAHALAEFGLGKSVFPSYFCLETP